MTLDTAGSASVRSARIARCRGRLPCPRASAGQRGGSGGEGEGPDAGAGGASVPERSRGASCTSCGRIQDLQRSIAKALHVWSPERKAWRKTASAPGCTMPRPKSGCIQRFPSVHVCVTGMVGLGPGSDGRQVERGRGAAGSFGTAPTSRGALRLATRCTRVLDVVLDEGRQRTRKSDLESLARCTFWR